MKIDDTLRLLSLTQAEINAITFPDAAGLLYNSTTSTVQFYDGSSWVNAGGSGGGDLLASNNLSDVANAATSLGNLNGEPFFAKNTAFNKDFGTISGTVLEGDKNAAIVLNTAKVSNVTTNLSLGPISSTTMDVNSSDGTNVTLTEADATFAGVMPAAKFNEVTANNAKVTNATHTGEVTGSGALTVDSTAISNKSSVTAAAGMEVLVNDAGTLKKADASDFLGGGGSTERFNLSRVETIDENSATPIEYFTFVQGGTEISNVISATGGDYEMVVSMVCTNTSTGGRIIVDPDIGGTSVFSQPFTREPKDSTDIFYVSISKDVTLAAGNNTINLQLSNSGGGDGRIFEANITLTKV